MIKYSVVCLEVCCMHWRSYLIFCYSVSTASSISFIILSIIKFLKTKTFFPRFIDAIHINFFMWQFENGKPHCKRWRELSWNHNKKRNQETRIRFQEPIKFSLIILYYSFQKEKFFHSILGINRIFDSTRENYSSELMQTSFFLFS